MNSISVPPTASPASLSDGDRQSTDDDDEREATELSTVDANGASTHPGRTPNADCAGSTGSAAGDTRWRAVKRFWGQQVSASVPSEACRDHFGM